MEIWKDVKGYEGLYKVSNFGNFKNIKLLKERKIKGCFDKNGYVISTFVKNKTKKTVKLHRLVASTFISNQLNKPQVNHINGIKDDNRVENLEWCTNSENQKHAHKIGLKQGKKGILCNFYNKTGKENFKSRKILDTKTNKIYDSLKLASEDLLINYNILSKNLNGQNKNKTSCVYFTVTPQ